MEMREGSQCKIAVISKKMIRGGVEKALINLLKSDEHLNKKVDLYLEDTTGEWTDQVKNNSYIIKINPKKLLNREICVDLIYRILLRISKSYNKQCLYTSKLLEKSGEEYELAISYGSPGSVAVFYTLYNINGKRKILYIHGDIEKCNCDTAFMEKHYGLFDEIRCVSKESYDIFIKCFPRLKDITLIEYNHINREEILELSKGQVKEFKREDFNILTVARLSEQKGIDLAIEVMNCLVEKDKNIRWFVCGDGELYESLYNKIQRYGLEEKFILLGATDNPYKYMNRCNLYVQPSKHEGYCLTLAEALTLGKYAICTRFAGALEQIDEGVTGNIVEYDVKSMTKAIRNYIVEHKSGVAE